MKKTVMIIGLSLITTLIYAQSDSLRRANNTGMIVFKPFGFFLGGQFMVDGHRMTRKQVGVLLINNPASADEFKEYRRYTRKSLFSGGAAIVLGLGTAVVGNNSSSFASTSALAFFGLALGAFVKQIIFAQKSDNHYRRSIDLYNQQYR